MRCKRCLVILLAVLFVTGMSSLPAKAEWFADLYLGVTVAQDDEMEVSYGSSSQNVDVSFDATGMIGYRMGYFFERAPFVGLALDGAYTNIEYADEEEIHLFGLTPLLMLRVPINKSDKYQQGEWLPFIAAGPGIYMSQLSTPGIDGNSVNIGWDLRLGVKKMVATNWAIGLEYRYAGFSPEFEDNDSGQDAKVEVDLNLHSLLFGVTYNF